jgi:hypothetical protein
MKTTYAACLARLGLSHTAAAQLHGGIRLDTVKSWSSGRNPAPQGAFDDLRNYEAQIIDASEAMREVLPEGAVIEANTDEAGHLPLMALADFILNCDAAVETGRTRATDMARQVRRPN